MYREIIIFVFLATLVGCTTVKVNTNEHDVDDTTHHVQTMKGVHIAIWSPYGFGDGASKQPFAGSEAVLVRRLSKESATIDRDINPNTNYVIVAPPFCCVRDYFPQDLTDDKYIALERKYESERNAVFSLARQYNVIILDIYELERRTMHAPASKTLAGFSWEDEVRWQKTAREHSKEAN